MLDQIKFDLESEIAEVRKSALRSLIQSNDIEDEDRLVLLKSIATQDDDPEIRAFARRYFDVFFKGSRKIETSLVEEAQKKVIFEEESSTEPLGEEVLRDGTADQKIEFLNSIMMGVVEVEKIKLYEYLADERDVFVIATFINCLGKIGDETDAENIVIFLSHGDSRVRANTVESLMKLKNEKMYEHVIPLLQDDDARVKANTARLLYSAGLDKTLETLSKMVHFGKRHQIESALFALKSLNNRKCLRLIEIATEKLADIEGELIPEEDLPISRDSGRHTAQYDGAMMSDDQLPIKICPSCASRNLEESQFCGNCRYSFTETGREEEQAAVQAEGNENIPFFEDKKQQAAIEHPEEVTQVDSPADADVVRSDVAATQYQESGPVSDVLTDSVLTGLEEALSSVSQESDNEAEPLIPDEDYIPQKYEPQEQAPIPSETAGYTSGQKKAFADKPQTDVDTQAVGESEKDRKPVDKEATKKATKKAMTDLKKEEQKRKAEKPAETFASSSSSSKLRLTVICMVIAIVTVGTWIHFGKNKVGAEKKDDMLKNDAIAKLDARNADYETSGFFKAIRSNDMDGIKRYLDTGVDPNIQDGEGNTPLIIAVQEHNMEVIKLLLSKKASVNHKNKNGASAIAFAINSKNQYEITDRELNEVELLFNNGAHTNIIMNRDSNITPLHSIVNALGFAITKTQNNRDLKVIDRLFAAAEKYAQSIPKVLNEKDLMGRTALFKLVSSFCLNELQRLYWRLPEEPKKFNKKGVGVATILLNNGALPEEADSVRKTTPLMIASNYLDTGFVRTLLQNGADPNAKDNEGKTPLMHAIRKGKWNENDKKDKQEVHNTVKLLLKSRADIKLKDNSGYTAMMYAIDEKNEIVAKLLKVLGADMGLKFKDGETVLQKYQAVGGK